MRLGAFTVVDPDIGRPDGDVDRVTEVVRLAEEAEAAGLRSLWVAVQRREAVPYVARRGLSIALIPYATVSSPEELAAVIADYRRALPAGTVGSVAAAVHLYGGERLDHARTAFHRYVQSRFAAGSTFLERKAQERPEHATPEAMERADLAIFGEPTEVVRRLERFAAAGVDDLLGIFDFGGLGPDEVAGSVRALGAAWADRSAR